MKFRNTILVIGIGVLISSCNLADIEKTELDSLQDQKDNSVAQDLINRLNNPPDSTKVKDVKIAYNADSIIAPQLLGKKWMGRANVGMDISFTDDHFIFHIKGEDPIEGTWKTYQDCNGVENSSGPYIMRTQDGHSECFLIVKLNEQELLLEYQGANIQMGFTRR